MNNLNSGAALDSEALASDGEALLHTALGQIANGDSYYGSMAREYKNIARTALGLGLGLLCYGIFTIKQRIRHQWPTATKQPQ